MAGTVSSTLYFSMGGTDLSTYISSIDLSEPVDIQLDNTYPATYNKRIGGLKDWSVRVTFHQDWSNGLLDDLLAAANGTSVAIEFRPASAVVGMNNPKRTGNAILIYDSPAQNFTPGQIEMATATFMGNGALTRAEA